MSNTICKGCEHFARTDSFNRVTYPYCNAVKNALPYTENSVKGKLVIIPLYTPVKGCPKLKEG